MTTAERPPEKDEFTGTETTGHEWDGIKELNTPLPRWWVWSFIACIIWSFGYWVVYPAWPLLTSHTEGVTGYSSRGAVLEELAAARAAQSGLAARVEAAALEDIRTSPDLLEFALAGGRSAFGLHCATCHGTGAEGAPGIPNLNDDDWIWGGDLEAIHATISFGVRADHDETRFNDMPAFVRDGLLTAEEAGAAAQFVLAMTDPSVSASPEGGVIFEEQCSACHGFEGEGFAAIGGPRLNDAIWFYGSSLEDITAQIAAPRHGMMPAWTGKLDAAAIKALTIYVHSLGGGE